MQENVTQRLQQPWQRQFQGMGPGHGMMGRGGGGRGGGMMGRGWASGTTTP